MGHEEQPVQNDWGDDALWQGLVARDARALEALIARYAREVAYFVRVVLDGVGTVQDAEECVNDLFVAAWDDIHSFDPARGAFRTWLTMRAKYLALDRRRQIQRRQAWGTPLSLSGEDRSSRSGGQPSELEIVHAQATETLDGLLERRERQQELRRALEALPELDRLLVYLRYFGPHSTEEIAARTGLTRRAIDTRLWRARRMLRDMMEAFERHPQEQTAAGS
jgi:RNA polymerase sigma factor (sigma-70 family)